MGKEVEGLGRGRKGAEGGGQAWKGVVEGHLWCQNFEVFFPVKL